MARSRRRIVLVALVLLSSSITLGLWQRSPSADQKSAQPPTPLSLETLDGMTLALQWADVQLAESRMLVRSSKTEHHDGKGKRVVPIFPELRPYLEQAWDEAEPGTQFVITRYRDVNANLRTQLQRIIAKAGLETWPKLFANLRASRATELAADHPGHVAAAWLGHSAVIANKHYWQVTEADFEQAIGQVATDDKTAVAEAAIMRRSQCAQGVV